MDLVIVLTESPVPFERRGSRFDTTSLPVPADLLVYTRPEWDRLSHTLGSRSLAAGVVWLAGSPRDGSWPRHPIR